MRFLAFVIIWASLGVGAVSTTTAYLWTFPESGETDSFLLGTGDDGIKAYAVLSADAGITEADEPVVAADTALTPEVVEKLQAQSVEPVERVRVKTFKLSRWSYLPHFVMACVGLLIGAMLTRVSAARAIKAEDAKAAQSDALSPEQAVAELREVVAGLLRDVPLERDDRRACALITDRLGDAIGDLVPAIADQRERLVARMGLGTYASLMDIFSSAERAINRAWSAAADQVIDESIESLERAAERLPIVEDKLTGRTPSLLPLG
ncbi:MAG: hypothetical protein Q9O74_00660 [Planctomycetota bacterium]|nr:hypothetical protein [Planctomycetota bacterium]